MRDFVFCYFHQWVRIKTKTDQQFDLKNAKIRIPEHIQAKVFWKNKTETLNYLLQTKLWEGNVFTPVCDYVHRDGLCPGRSLSRGVSVTETPGTVEERAVHILLECILVSGEKSERNNHAEVIKLYLHKVVKWSFRSRLPVPKPNHFTFLMFFCFKLIFGGWHPPRNF